MSELRLSRRAVKDLDSLPKKAAVRVLEALDRLGQDPGSVALDVKALAGRQTGQRGGARYVLSDEVVMRAGATGLEAQSRKRQMLLDEIRRRGNLSTAEGAALLAEDTVLVRHLLNDLVRARLAVARGRTRARRYYPT